MAFKCTGLVVTTGARVGIAMHCRVQRTSRAGGGSGPAGDAFYGELGHRVESNGIAAQLCDNNRIAVVDSVGGYNSRSQTPYRPN